MQSHPTCGRLHRACRQRSSRLLHSARLSSCLPGRALSGVCKQSCSWKNNWLCTPKSAVNLEVCEWSCGAVVLLQCFTMLPSAGGCSMPDAFNTSPSQFLHACACDDAKSASALAVAESGAHPETGRPRAASPAVCPRRRRRSRPGQNLRRRAAGQAASTLAPALRQTGQQSRHRRRRRRRRRHTRASPTVASRRRCTTRSAAPFRRRISSSSSSTRSCCPRNSRMTALPTC